MRPGVLPLRYAEEANRSGMTALGRLPVQVEFLQATERLLWPFPYRHDFSQSLHARSPKTHTVENYSFLP